VIDDAPAITLPLLRAALDLRPFDGREAQRVMEPETRGRPPPGHADRPPRDAAALAYAFPRDGRLHLPITLRCEDMREHSGQVSLPGGRPEDGEDLLRTALREAEEEIALAPRAAEPLGRLAPVYIPVTHTRLHVHVAHGPAPERFVANPAEVVRIEVVPLGHLVAPAFRRSTTRRILGRDVDVPYFDLGGLEVWGATAMALSELAERLRAVV
jgi:8-oxo-dGTP pyrophosphatase MutT (NUDIX family)